MTENEETSLDSVILQNEWKRVKLLLSTIYDIDLDSASMEVKMLVHSMNEIVLFEKHGKPMNPLYESFWLSKPDINFLDISNSTDSDDVLFFDEGWSYCKDGECIQCEKHSLHHGKTNGYNPDGITKSIWQQFVEKQGPSTGLTAKNLSDLLCIPLHIIGTIEADNYAETMAEWTRLRLREMRRSQYASKSKGGVDLPWGAALEGWEKAFKQIGLGEDWSQPSKQNSAWNPGFDDWMKKQIDNEQADHESEIFPANLPKLTMKGVNKARWITYTKSNWTHYIKSLADVKGMQAWNTNVAAVRGEAYTQDIKSTKGEKKMSKTKKPNLKIAERERAVKILGELERFDHQLGGSAIYSGFTNSVRMSSERLRDFLDVLLDNLTKEEALDIIPKQYNVLKCDEMLLPEDMGKLVRGCYDKRSKKLREDRRNELFSWVEDAVKDTVDWCVASKSLTSLGLHRYVGHTREREAGKGLDDERVLMEKYLDEHTEKFLTHIFVLPYLSYQDDDSQGNPASQKAKGIKSISKRSTMQLSVKADTLLVPLDAANESTNRELLASVGRAWASWTVSSTLAKGLYIRTCPAAPRPGALPNVLAKTPRQYIDGIRMLGMCMTDPNHIDYDPQGCLVVQEFIRPMCSAVMTKGGDSITVGPSHDGVTAGGGSNIVFTLSPKARRKFDEDISSLGLEDGMEHHEAELVWPLGDRVKKIAMQYRECVEQKKHGEYWRFTPKLTQMRGLHTPKEDLHPPPTVNGVTLHIRGNVPAGSVEQLVVIDVGSGDLSECIHLEQMAEKDELPEGLVVYAPSGSPSAHVAGVGMDFGFPVIYGIKPRKNHVVWTEINGWVTDEEGAEPQPYSPSPFMDFYKIGLRDGDRFWTYNLAPLSQFFHNFISGPKNDPRLEAYLAGIYTSWIIKAALAVAMGEFRHGIGSERAPGMTPHRVFSHILIQQAISGESGVDSMFVRNDYYQRLNYNELGYDLIHEIAKFYTDSYTSKYARWAGGSFGGTKYLQSTKPTVMASYCIKALLRGEDIDLETVLNEVNKLENAVHNTGFFFNKFLGDKTAFDIGTGGHSSLQYAPEHWLATAPFYALFYTNYVNEPHRVAKGHDALVARLLSNEREVGDTSLRDVVERAVLFARSPRGVLVEDIETEGFDKYKGLYDKVQKDTTMHLTEHGPCGFPACGLDVCKSAIEIIEMGFSKEVRDKVLKALESYVTSIHFNLQHIEHKDITEVLDVFHSEGTRAPSQTVFIEAERKMVANEVTTEKVYLCEGIYGIDEGPFAWIIRTGDREYIHFDHLIERWVIHLQNDDVQNWLRNNSTYSEQYHAWRDPAQFIRDFVWEDVGLGEEEAVSICDQVETIDDLIREHSYSTHSQLYSPLSKMKAIEIIQALISSAIGHKPTSRELLIEFNSEGRITKDGEIQ